MALFRLWESESLDAKMTQEPKAREWWVAQVRAHTSGLTSKTTFSSDRLLIGLLEEYEKLVKAHDEMVSINREFQKLFKQTIIESRKDYEGMRSFQRKFIEADQRLIDVERRAEGLVEILKIIASHDYAGIAMADAHITLAREALEKGSK